MSSHNKAESGETTGVCSILKETLKNLDEVIDSEQKYVVVQQELIDHSLHVASESEFRTFCRLDGGRLSRVENFRIQQVMISEKPVADEESNGDLAWVGVPVCCEDGIVGVIVCSGVDENKTDLTIQITQAVASQTELVINGLNKVGEIRRHARHDDLTGVFNRRYFVEVARREISRSKRYENPLSLIMLDLDHFKRINDNYGHAVGDTVLVKMVERLKKDLRTVDILGRYGGEEFFVLLPETDVCTANRVVAERLRSTISEKPVSTDSGLIEVTASFGVAGLTQDIGSFDELLDYADQAMYRAKNRGRNCIVERRADGDYRRAG